MQSERTCEELVCGSPKLLVEKLAWLEQNGSARADEARRALDGLKLKPGEFLFLLDEWYDYNCFGRSHGLGLLDCIWYSSYRSYDNLSIPYFFPISIVFCLKTKGVSKYS